MATGDLDLFTFKLADAKIFVYNICLISINDTVADGATNTLVLNIEGTARLPVPMNSSEMYVKNTEYFLCDADLKLKIIQRIYEGLNGVVAFTANG